MATVLPYPQLALPAPSRAWPSDFTDKVLLGDCFQVMREMPDGCVDCIVTDPPYGISFMGKHWDRALPPVEIWSEALRVLKDGAFAFVMCIPRQDCLSRMIISLEDAGFNVNFTSLYWAYASGFPKAENISLTVDRRACRAELREQPGRDPTKKEFDEAWKIYRKVIGKYQPPNGDEWNLKQAEDPTIGHIEPAFTSSGVRTLDITEPRTEEAKELNGAYSFNPKPAVEVIIVAMKPLSEKTYVDQALANRKGVMWLDDARIPFEETPDPASNPLYRIAEGYKLRERGQESKGVTKFTSSQNETNSQGRFPANLLVSDDVLNDGQFHPAGDLTGQKGTVGNVYGVYNRERELYSKGNPVDSFSRYFSLDAWWSERIKGLPQEVQKTFPFLIVPKASKSEKDKGCEDFEMPIGHNRFDQCEICGGYILQNPDRPSACKCENPVRKNNTIKGNYHPTVKPVQLGVYLVTLGSREGDLILDPFTATGSFCISAWLEARHFIGIEIDPESHKIGEARVKDAMKGGMQIKLSSWFN